MFSNQLRQLAQNIFHTNNDFIATENCRFFSIHKRAYDSATLRAVLNEPDSFLQSKSVIEVLKADHSSTVVKIHIDDKYLIIKRHNLKNFWQTLKRAFSTSRAAKNWRNAHYLKLLNIPTANPVAMIEKRWGPFRRESYFISEYVAAEHLLHLAQTNYSIKQMQTIAIHMKCLFAALGSVRLAHGDMKATNILIVDNYPLLLDLDAMNLYRTHWRWQRAACRDWQRFMKNWQAYPELQAIFVKAKL